MTYKRQIWAFLEVWEVVEEEEKKIAEEKTRFWLRVLSDSCPTILDAESARRVVELSISHITPQLCATYTVIAPPALHVRGNQS